MALPRISLLAGAAALACGFSACQQPAGIGGGAAGSLPGPAGTLNRDLLARLPANPSSFGIFERYNPNGSALWTRGWTRRLDLTGIAWDGDKAGVLVSPQHVLMASHSNRKIGSPLVFHDRSGRDHVRVLYRKATLPGGLMPDVTVGLLDQPVPVTSYRLLPPRADYPSLLPGTLALLTNHRREIHAHEIDSAGGRRVSYRRAGDLPEAWFEALVTGDSGFPSFLVLRGELILLSTHTFGGPGAGPLLSDPVTFSEINRVMAELGGPEQLRTVSFP